MAGISISGLVSNSFDWQSIVNQLIAIDSKPIAKLQTEESENIDKLAVFSTLQSKLTDLQTAAQAFSEATLYTGRSAASTTSGSTWSATASNGVTAGSYSIAVTQLATAARLNGGSNIARPLNASATDYDPDTNPNGIGGLTLASLPVATSITAGTFSINGKQVTIATSDSLQDVFDKINAADSSVTASYNRTTDKITLTSGSEIVLGAANDSSNFLTAMRLSNNATGSVSSSVSLGTASTKVTLNNARLSTAFAATSGSFTVNGVSVAYDTTTDSLSTVLSRISSSAAGVTASYDSTNDRIVLTNNSTGDTGVSVSDVGGGNLAAALGITSASGASLVHGKNAIFTVNGGDTVTSTSNTLDETALGVTGLSVTVDTAGTQTVKVSANTDAVSNAINTFISKFNAVQSYIDSETKITKTADGKVTTATLAGNHEVEHWASDLRSMAFSSISGLSGTIKNLGAMGIGFSSTSSTLSITDSSKLSSALASNIEDVTAFFTTATTGFAAKLDSYLSKKLNTRDGAIQMQMDTLNKANKSIDAQIVTLNSRLAAQKERLTSAFIAMQTAQSQASQQQKSLEQFLKSSSSSS